MKAYMFPGQGAQFVGMAKELSEGSDLTRAMLAEANAIVGFDLAEVMCNGSEDDLRQTRVTQPAIFLHAVIVAALRMPTAADAQPAAVAGHSLGEFSALVAAKVLTWQAALALVAQRAEAMQAACELAAGTMAAIMTADLSIVEQTCEEVQAELGHIVVAANYNNPGQLVISGSIEGVKIASERLAARGAKAIPLSVGGAFHSPLMQPAQDKLQAAIESTVFSAPICPIYQNVDAQPTTDVETIKTKLAQQLTAPVRWQQIIENMLAANINEFVEVGGRGSILLGMVRKINRAAVMTNL
jgi:[acyl-carrier-protein] S-malonyltransferase